MIVNLLPHDYRKNNRIKITKRVMLEVLLGIVLMTLAMNFSLYLQTKIMIFEMEQVELRLASESYRNFAHLEERIENKQAYLELLEEKVRGTNKNPFDFIGSIESLLSLQNTQVNIQTLSINAPNNTLEIKGTTGEHQIFFEYFKWIERSFSFYETYFYLEPIKEDENITFYIGIYPREKEQLADEEIDL